MPQLKNTDTVLFVGDEEEGRKILPLARAQFANRDKGKGGQFGAEFFIGDARVRLERNGVNRRITIDAGDGGISGILLDPDSVRGAGLPYVLIKPGGQSAEAEQMVANPDELKIKITKGVKGLNADIDEICGVNAWIARGEYRSKLSRFSWSGRYVYRSGKKIYDTGGAIVHGVVRFGKYIVVATNNAIRYGTDSGGVIRASLESLVVPVAPSGNITNYYLSPGGTKIVAIGGNTIYTIELSLDDDGDLVAGASSRSAGETWPSPDPVDNIPVHGVNALGARNSDPVSGYMEFTGSASHSITGVAGIQWDSISPTKDGEETYSDIMATYGRSVDFGVRHETNTNLDTSTDNFNGAIEQVGHYTTHKWTDITFPGQEEIRTDESLIDKSWTMTKTWTQVGDNLVGQVDIVMDCETRTRFSVWYFRYDGIAELYSVEDFAPGPATITHSGEEFTIPVSDVDGVYTPPLRFLMPGDDPNDYSTWTSFIPTNDEATEEGFLLDIFRWWKSIALWGPMIYHTGSDPVVAAEASKAHSAFPAPSPWPYSGDFTHDYTAKVAGAAVASENMVTFSQSAGEPFPWLPAYLCFPTSAYPGFRVTQSGALNYGFTVVSVESISDTDVYFTIRTVTLDNLYAFDAQTSRMNGLWAEDNGVVVLASFDRLAGVGADGFGPDYINGFNASLSSTVDIEPTEIYPVHIL